MRPGVHKLTEDIWLDARRALWLRPARTLVVSDLHLGYAWAHRHDGQLLPLGSADETEVRLTQLRDDYQPRRIVLLGDVIHRSVPVPALRAQVVNLTRELGRQSVLTIVGGNHDRHLESFLAAGGEHLEVSPHVVEQRCLLVHGDNRPGRIPLPDPGKWDRVVIGHEHPAVNLGDGVASWVRCPCFLISAEVVVLPAFSIWAAGSVIGDHSWMSSWARAARFHQAIAIAGKRLLPLALK